MSYINSISRFNTYQPSFAGKPKDDEDDDEVSEKKKSSKKDKYKDEASSKALALAEKNSGKLLSGSNIMGVLGLVGLVVGGVALYKGINQGKVINGLKESVDAFTKTATENTEKIVEHAGKIETVEKDVAANTGIITSFKETFNIHNITELPQKIEEICRQITQ